MMKYLPFILLLSLCSTALADQHQDTDLAMGKRVYLAACQNCHSPEFADSMRAPAAFDTKAWQARLAAAKQATAEDSRFSGTADYLVHQVSRGRGLMHHGGLCKESKVNDPDLVCNDETYIQAINYMAGLKGKHKLALTTPSTNNKNQHDEQTTTTEDNT